MYKAVYCRKKSFLIDVRFCEILLTSQIQWNLANKTTLILRKRWSIDKSGLSRESGSTNITNTILKDAYVKSSIIVGQKF